MLVFPRVGTAIGFGWQTCHVQTSSWEEASGGSKLPTNEQSSSQLLSVVKSWEVQRQWKMEENYFGFPLQQLGSSAWVINRNEMKILLPGSALRRKLELSLQMLPCAPSN